MPLSDPGAFYVRDKNQLLAADMDHASLGRFTVSPLPIFLH